VLQPALSHPEASLDSMLLAEMTKTR